MKDYFEKNLQEIIKINPVLGARLFGISEIKDFDVYVDEKDLANINIIDKRDFTPLYNTKPIDETLNSIKEFEKCSRYPYLYFYGIANGIFIRLMLNNEQHRRIMVIEPEIEILYIALHFNDFANDIANERLLIHLSDEVTFTQLQPYFQHEEKIYIKSYHLDTIADYYHHKYEEDIIKVNKDIVKAIEHCILGLGNDSTDALLGIEQHITNVEQMIKTPTTVSLVKHAKNTELAIIVSTGPSLAKQLPLLDKIKDYVTIISVDASFPILEKHNIKPDIVVSMERIPNTAKFFINTSKEFQEDVIFAMTSIQDKAVLESIKGGTIQISMRPFGYTRYFDVDDWGYIGIGMSAANFAFEIAYQSKFKRVVLIGQDLAYGDDGTTHSKGHTFGEKERDFRYDDSQVTAYGGNGTVRSSLVWNLFRNFFEIDISNVYMEMDTINATEGGARITGSIEMPFNEVIDKYVDFSKPKQKIILDKPTPEEIAKNTLYVRQRLDLMLEYATKIYNEVINLFEEISKEIENFNKIEARKYLELVNYDDVYELIKKLDKIKEYFADREFALVFTDATQAFIFHQEVDIAIIQIRDSNTEKEKKLKMIDWIYVHQYWLFSLAGSIKATIDTMLFGINEKNSQEFLQQMLDKYSDIKDYDEFMFSKNKFLLKKRLFPGKDFGPYMRISYLLELLKENYGYKKINYSIENDFVIKNNNLINYSRPMEVLNARNLLIEVLGNLQLDMIKKSLSTDKKNILLFIQDTINCENGKAMIGLFMRKEYQNIISCIDQTKYNIITAINRPLEKGNCHYFADVPKNVIIDDCCNDFDTTYKPFMLGWDLIADIDFVDCIVTIDESSANILELYSSWRRVGKYKDLTDFVYPNTNIIKIKEETYQDILKSL